MKKLLLITVLALASSSSTWATTYNFPPVPAASKDLQPSYSTLSTVNNITPPSNFAPASRPLDNISQFPPKAITIGIIALCLALIGILFFKPTKEQDSL